MLQVSEAEGARFELALERLRQGHAFSFNDVSFSLVGDSLYISVVTTWLAENLTEERAIDDLTHGRNVYETLQSESSTFAAEVRDYSPTFILIGADGMGSVELARLVNQRVVWAKGIVVKT